MPRKTKPSGPKFEPVEIAEIDPRALSLVIPAAESADILSKETSRRALEHTMVFFQRLSVLGDFLGVDPTNHLAMLMAVANEFVPGFAVTKEPKAGRQKKADRFHIVTTVEDAMVDQGITESAAIKMLGDSNSLGMTAETLRARYYEYRGEIQAAPETAAWLNIWRKARSTTPTSEFQEIFWSLETRYLGAKQPHNVRSLRAVRK